MRIHAARLLGGIACAALLAGCTTTSAGEAGPAPTLDTKGSTPSSSSEEASDLPSDGAPKVANPLEADRFEDDPCQALTDAQTAELNIVNTGEPFDGNFGKGCQWSGRNHNGGSAIIDFLSDEPRGMSSLYRSDKNGEFAFFEELDAVAGHPMVAFDTADTRDKGGECAVAVGLTDELAFLVSIALSSDNVGNKDPCEVGSQVATMMLTTMGAS